MKRDIEHELAHVMRGSNFIEIFIFRFVFWEILNSEFVYYQYANLLNSWNTRGLQWVKPLRLSWDNQIERLSQLFTT